MNLVNLILEKMASSFIEKRKLDLSPNPNLPPVERYLQSNLLDLINQFGTIALMIDVIGPDEKLLKCWSDAHIDGFSQIISHFTWE